MLTMGCYTCCCRSRHHHVPAALLLLLLNMLMIMMMVLFFQCDNNNNVVHYWKNRMIDSPYFLIQTNEKDATAIHNNNNHQHVDSKPLSPSLTSSSNSPPPLLRNIHMVMMGDSVMRYQYLSLAFRLRHGLWFHYHNNNNNNNNNDTTLSSSISSSNIMWYYNLVDERSFQDPYHSHTWGEFLYHTHRILQPYEVVCDCHCAPVKEMKQIVENRHYYDPILNNSLVFLLAYGQKKPVMGRLDPTQVRNQTAAWQQKAFRQFNMIDNVGGNGGAALWKYRYWSDVIYKYIRRLDPQPKHIVMNAGLWSHNFGWTPTQNVSKHTERLFQAIQDTSSSSSSSSYHYVWRTTTCGQDRRCFSTDSDTYMCQQLQQLQQPQQQQHHSPTLHHHQHNIATCVNVSFTGQIRRDLYWDHSHFYEPVYRAMNEEMLDQLGYLPEEYVRMNLSDILE